MRASTHQDAICLQIQFSEFVARHIGEMEGIILEAETGDLLGKHRGFWFYTIGQRQGLRLPGGPWYAPSLTLLLMNTRFCYKVDLYMVVRISQFLSRNLC